MGLGLGLGLGLVARLSTAASKRTPVSRTGWKSGPSKVSMGRMCLLEKASKPAGFLLGSTAGGLPLRCLGWSTSNFTATSVISPPKTNIVKTAMISVVCSVRVSGQGEGEGEG